MADLQVGNVHGFAARGNANALLASVTADGVNTVTVDDVSRIRAGMVIDLVNKTTGAVLAAGRTVTNITNAGVVTYDGADVAATNVHGVYLTGTYGAGPSKTNLNGGVGDREGLDIDHLDTIAAMRARLVAINGTYYTAARLNEMTYNDMAYAIRVNDQPGSLN